MAWNTATLFSGAKYLKDSEEEESEEEEDEEEGSAKSGSTSSFSLQECIDEFRARRVRRVSGQSRDCENNNNNMTRAREEQLPRSRRATDADLINQNRSNKEQERKGKPCKDGFCYCFTSDSGDCASIAPPRDQHVRLPRRSRRSDSSKATKQNNLGSQGKQTEKRRQSEPPNIRSCSRSKSPLTAVSRLSAVDGDDAPLIHIIQELRDNCVVSEVRVNRQRFPQSASSCQHRNSRIKASKLEAYEAIAYKPSAPVLSNISEQDSAVEEEELQQELEVEKEMPTTEASSRKNSRSRRSSGAGGRLLQKRLSQTQVNFKARDVHQPPKKPPRRSSQSLDGKCSQSSLASTNPSVREAERVLDEFLRKHGIEVPVSNLESKSSRKKDGQRRSYPMAEVEKPKSRSKQLPTCPSLSDIERVVESKKGSNYSRNIRQESNRKSGPSKQIILGWTEPKITEMLNYEGKSAREFKSLAPPAEPQVSIGWQVPKPQPQPVVPKVSLDTVDGIMSENFAANMEHKETPIKYPKIIKTAGGQASQKFIWGEQWRNLSPWKGNKSKKLGSKSKNFLNNSKKKILRFVSPKKSNQQEPPREEQTRPPPKLCTVGVQTSTSQLDLQSQSPPGSYHSPMQTTPSGTTTSTRQHLDREQPYFDFDRKVDAPTPPKKIPRANRARKLDFQTEAAPTTYRSYHKDLDQDVTLTKMGYLLSSIRSKLEASDERAIQTFRDCSRFESRHSSLEQFPRQTESYDCTDGPSSQTTVSVGTTRPLLHRELDSEPIYSEIEEDCMRIRGSPHHEVKTAVQRITPTPTATPPPSSASYVSEITPVPSPSSADVEAMYARVQKTPKNSPQIKGKPSQLIMPPQEERTEIVVQKMPPQRSNQVVQSGIDQNTHNQPVALGHFLHESLKNGSFFQFMPLPEEPSGTESSCSASQTTASSVIRQSVLKTSPPLIHQSLNNISEKDSPPKSYRNLSRSQLSLQRSEIFLDNLCRSELVLDRLEKVPNTCSNVDSVSYDLPNEGGDELYGDYSMGEAESGRSSIGGNDYGSGQIDPQPENQSTPKKQVPPKSQRFTTKPTRNLSIDINDSQTTPLRPLGQNISFSCPTTPQQAELQVGNSTGFHNNSSSLVELGQVTLPNNPSDSQLMSVSALARCRLLKDALRRSYRKGKDFFKAEKLRLTNTLNISRDQSNQTDGELDSSSYYASFNLDSLLNESLTTNEQLAQAVSICRQMPELEISAEMVEAERLLLFSSLRKSKPGRLANEEALASRRQSQCLLIDGMKLPVRADVNQDMFFNYHYICTFECGGRIRSTQSVECQNGSALFRDCGLEFYSADKAESLELHCQIFMLRLRKVSTLSLEPAKSLRRGSGNLGSSNSSSSAGSGSEHIVSRFRLHASFTLRAMDLSPFEVVGSETKASDTICLRSSRSWPLPIKAHTKSTNLGPGIAITGRVDLRLPKTRFSGYLNVQDPRNQHHWNRRWCSLDGLELSVWQHEHNLENETPIFSLELPGRGKFCVEAAPRDLCARARSFLLQGKESDYESGVFFAADTQAELLEWLRHLNEALEFARHWLSAP
ncbi:uncharacterized protein Dana_GF11828, isoform A [Drosophila ananassae]|uniref:Uncharacterized protein, isoform A n=1 Tax=Drosophila ananassae TaxID=7217 RepID=B3MFI9_DROAN|nr:uncharacterized protein LOC6494690 isoform X2 [Drosophila ananassae]EDV36674.1 uncharacterized protein Dana_GF11828, isoform A [Drosophila ananassae]